MKVKIYLSYNLGDNSYSKEFNSYYELEKFIEKLFEIKQTKIINLDSSSIELVQEQSSSKEEKGE